MSSKIKEWAVHSVTARVCGACNVYKGDAAFLNNKERQRHFNSCLWLQPIRPRCCCRCCSLLPPFGLLVIDMSARARQLQSLNQQLSPGEGGVDVPPTKPLNVWAAAVFTDSMLQIKQTVMITGCNAVPCDANSHFYRLYGLNLLTAPFRCVPVLCTRRHHFFMATNPCNIATNGTCDAFNQDFYTCN